MLTRFPLPDGAMMAAAAVSYNQEDRGTLYVYFFNGGGEIAGRINPVFAEGERPVLVADATGRLHLSDASGRELVYDLASSRWTAIEPTPAPPTPDIAAIRESNIAISGAAVEAANSQWNEMHANEDSPFIVREEGNALFVEMNYMSIEGVAYTHRFIEFRQDGSAVFEYRNYRTAAGARSEISVSADRVSYNGEYGMVVVNDENGNPEYAFFEEFGGLWLSAVPVAGTPRDVRGGFAMPMHPSSEYIASLRALEDRWIAQNQRSLPVAYAPVGREEWSERYSAYSDIIFLLEGVVRYSSFGYARLPNGDPAMVAGSAFILRGSNIPHRLLFQMNLMERYTRDKLVHHEEGDFLYLYQHCISQLFDFSKIQFLILTPNHYNMNLISRYNGMGTYLALLEYPPEVMDDALEIALAYGRETELWPTLENMYLLVVVLGGVWE